MSLPTKAMPTICGRDSNQLPDQSCSQAIPRLTNGQFRPGASGNPGGRPAALAEVRQLSRQHTALAVQTLAHIVEHGHSEMAQIAAANALLDRGWGRPTQPVSGDDDMPSVGIGFGTLNEAERDRLVAVLIEGLRQ